MRRRADIQRGKFMHVTVVVYQLLDGLPVGFLTVITAHRSVIILYLNERERIGRGSSEDG